jgi:hypothetical protein
MIPDLMGLDVVTHSMGLRAKGVVLVFPNSSWRFGVHYYNLQSILPSLLPLLGFCAPASLITCWPSLAAEHTNTHTHTLAHSHKHTHTLSLSITRTLARCLFIHHLSALALASFSLHSAPVHVQSFAHGLSKAASTRVPSPPLLPPHVPLPPLLIPGLQHSLSRSVCLSATELPHP